jgi:hypothetical protein
MQVHIKHLEVPYAVLKFEILKSTLQKPVYVNEGLETEALGPREWVTVPCSIVQSILVEVKLDM